MDVKQASVDIQFGDNVALRKCAPSNFMSSHIYCYFYMQLLESCVSHDNGLREMGGDAGLYTAMYFASQLYSLAQSIESLHENTDHLIQVSKVELNSCIGCVIDLICLAMRGL